MGKFTKLALRENNTMLQGRVLLVSLFGNVRAKHTAVSMLVV